MRARSRRDRPRALLSARSGGSRALPRVRAAADGRWAPVPARARRPSSSDAGSTVEVNRISAGTGACLFNSFNFDFRRLRRFARDDVRFVHRVDGPIATYRGFDDGTDARIAEINRELADATIVQSRYSRDAHLALGIELVDPRLISNAADPSIFHPPAEREPLAGRRVRVIATSWSDNPNKGAEVIAWLDRHLDHDRYELTFAGRTRRDVRARSCPRTDRVGAARRRAAAQRRLSGAEPERPLLERAARGARERAPGRLPRERRASGARRRRRRAVRRARGGRRSARPPRLRARRAPCRDPRGTARGGCRSLSRGASRVTRRVALARHRSRAAIVRREDARVAESLTSLRRRRANDAGPWTRTRDISKRPRDVSGTTSVPPRWARFATEQSVFLTSHFEALQPRWLQSTHRLATAYLHGRPGTPGYPEFDRAYDALRSAPERFARIQVTHEEMRELVLEAGVEPSAVHVIAIGIDIEQFPLVTPEYRAAARAALDLPGRRLRGRLVPEGRRRLGRGSRAEAREGAGRPRCRPRASRGGDLRAARASYGAGPWLRPQRARAARDRVSAHRGAESQRVGHARTTPSTRTSSPPVRREGRRACSSRWPRASRSSRRASGRHRASCATGRTGFSSTSTTSRRSRPRFCASTTTPACASRSVRPDARPPSSTRTNASIPSWAALLEGFVERHA